MGHNPLSSYIPTPFEHEHLAVTTMAQPSTPGPGAANSIFGPAAVHLSSSVTTFTPGSATSSNNTFLMPNSPVKGRLGMDRESYRPKVTRTLGQRPACLVNASVTYCGNNQIYAFGGFDQYTDEVYNHVLKLDMISQQWSLVDNYGDIPGVRMGKAHLQPSSTSTASSNSNIVQVIPRRYIKVISSSFLEAKTNIEHTCQTSSSLT